MSLAIAAFSGARKPSMAGLQKRGSIISNFDKIDLLGNTRVTKAG